LWSFLKIACGCSRVILPKTLPAGDYVLGWRWDCEETAQIWANCADVTIAAAGSA
jgi:predicted carbohydrate-binding protein with CBM5 and CBM33 domain